MLSLVFESMIQGVKYLSGRLGDYIFNVVQRFSAKHYYTKQRHSNDQQKETSDFEKKKKKNILLECLLNAFLWPALYVMHHFRLTLCVPIKRRGNWLHNVNSIKSITMERNACRDHRNKTKAVF